MATKNLCATVLKQQRKILSLKEDGNLTGSKQEPLNRSLADQNGEQVHSRWLNMDALNLIGPALHTSSHHIGTYRVPATCA